MKTLREYIAEAREKSIAIGHFNISNSEGLSAVYDGARELNVPVIVGVSEGERDFIGIERVVAMVRELRKKNNFPIFINADHTYSVNRVKEAIDSGFDSVIYDGVKLPFGENVLNTKKCVEYAKNSGRDVIVEAELGFIGTSSKVLDSIPEGAEVTPEMMTKVEEAVKFVEKTGVDLLAPAIGNVHGMLRSGMDPRLDINRTKEIYQAIKIPLVLHGGSGTNTNDFVDVIKNGVAIVHISTELRVALREGIEEGLNKNQDEVAPYKYMNFGVDHMKKVVIEKLKLFNGLS